MSIANVNAASAPEGTQGEKQLAAGHHVALRLWENEEPGEPIIHHFQHGYEPRC